LTFFKGHNKNIVISLNQFFFFNTEGNHGEIVTFRLIAGIVFVLFEEAEFIEALWRQKRHYNQTKCFNLEPHHWVFVAF